MHPCIQRRRRGEPRRVDATGAEGRVAFRIPQRTWCARSVGLRTSITRTTLEGIRIVGGLRARAPAGDNGGRPIVVTQRAVVGDAPSLSRTVGVTDRRIIFFTLPNRCSLRLRRVFCQKQRARAKRRGWKTAVRWSDYRRLTPTTPPPQCAVTAAGASRLEPPACASRARLRY